MLKLIDYRLENMLHKNTVKTMNRKHSLCYILSGQVILIKTLLMRWNILGVQVKFSSVIILVTESLVSFHGMKFS